MSEDKKIIYVGLDKGFYDAETFLSYMENLCNENIFTKKPCGVYSDWDGPYVTWSGHDNVHGIGIIYQLYLVKPICRVTAYGRTNIGPAVKRILDAAAGYQADISSKLE